MKKIIFLAALVLVFAISIIGILLNKDNLGSIFFWANLGWLIFLILLNIGISGLFYSESDAQNEQSSRSIAVLPSINILVFSYSFLSIAMLAVNIFSERLDLLSFASYHLVFQIALGSLFLFISLLVFIAAKGAEK